MTAAVLLVLIDAHTECMKSWVCDDNGQNCVWEDVCDDALDLPAINIQEPKPLPSIELKPLPTLNLPPLGTKKCEWKQVNGVWMEVCE